MQKGRRHVCRQVACNFLCGYRIWVCFEVVDGIGELGEEMLAHACVFGLRVNDGCLFSFLGGLLWVRGASSGAICRRGGIVVRGGGLETDDCPREDRLVLGSMPEGSELCVKGTHDGRRSGMLGCSGLLYSGQIDMHHPD